MLACIAIRRMRRDRAQPEIYAAQLSQGVVLKEINGGVKDGSGAVMSRQQLDQAAGIGFLIAAKSVLRFETTSKDQKAGEYVIIGTLASFGWALLFGYATRALLADLPPLGILPANP